MVAIHSFSNQIGMISARSRLIRKDEFSHYLSDQPTRGD
jgi:hypothetical protein